MKTSHKEDLYERVTTAIIETLEQGQGTRLEWLQTGRGMPRNHQTGAAYQGVNVLLLWTDAVANGYTSDRWLTYKQAMDMGGQVRKGEKSVTCVFSRRLSVHLRRRATTPTQANLFASSNRSGYLIWTR